MDFLDSGKKLRETVKKYRAVLVVVLAGVLLMALPKKENKPEPMVFPQPEAADFQQSLEELLCEIDGAGKVHLLLSPVSGEKTIYQSDEDREGDSLRRSTVVISDRDRQERGLIRQVDPPRYGGAVVLAQGAGSPAVKLAIVKAVSSAAGLTSDKITVLKMK